MRDEIEKKAVTIEVTAEAIKAGKQNHTNACPIALSIKPFIRRGLKKAFNVTNERIIFNMRERLGTEEVGLPQKATKFIKNFDSDDEKARQKAKSFKFRAFIPVAFLPKAA